MNPKDRRYTKEHEWAKLEGDIAVVGITHYAQDQLGDVVYVELPSVGTRVQQDKAFGVIESVKTASDLYAPLSGEIVEVNQPVIDQPQLVNESPYDQGWLIKIKPDNLAEMDALLSAEEYEQEVGE